MIADGVMTFYPTPTYTISRDYEYKAGWALSGGSYAEMGDTEAGIVLLLAASKVLGLQASKAAQEAWSYQIGDERVSKERLSEQLRLQGDALRVQYMEAVQMVSGSRITVARRATYDLDAYE